MKDKSILVAASLLAVGTAAGLFGARFLTKAPPGLSSTAPASPAPLPANLPPRDNSDLFVREQAAALSSDPVFQEWLKRDSLISRLSAAINMAAHGKISREILAPFAPRGKFIVMTKDGRVIADPAGYARYDKIAALARSVDAAAAAKVFELLLPLFDAAQRALGEPNTSAREALFTAARELLSAPVIDGELPLKQGKKGIGWTYADEHLENLSPAQKQVIRLGPKNQREFQAKLREITLALGARL